MCKKYGNGIGKIELKYTHTEELVLRRESEMINRRQLQLVRNLYKVEGYMTVSELAEKLEVSTKTVRNDIAAINEYLAENNAGVIQAKAHSGVKLVNSSGDKEKMFGQFSQGDGEQDKMIVWHMIEILLKKDQLNSLKFMEENYLSRGSFDRMLEEVKAWFLKHNIVLERKRGKGIRINYSEYDYRIAFFDFYDDAREYLKQTAITKTSRYASLNQLDYNIMTELFDGFDSDKVAEAVIALEEKYGFVYSAASNSQLIFLISLSVTRMQRGAEVKTLKRKKCKTDGNFNGLLVKDLISKLESVLGCNIPQTEIAFIEFTVAISEISDFTDDASRRFAELQDIELCRFTVRFSKLCGEMAGVNFSLDKLFLKQMFLQLKPMISRLEYGTGIKNPLLKQIKDKYPNMMALAWAGANLFYKELGLKVNEHEVAFLALYIGGAIERKSVALRACIVCNYGVGISQILREKIEREINDLEITAVISSRDLRKIREEDCDFVISTIPINTSEITKDVIVVDHLLLFNDIDSIAEIMKKKRKEKLSHRQRLSERTFLNSLYNPDFIFIDIEAESKEELIRKMCNKLETSGYVTEEFVDSVLDRETYTSTEVGKSVALPHGNPDFVSHSVVSVAKLKSDMEWFDGVYVDIVFLLAFDMEDQGEVRNEIIRFYKSFVSFLEDDKQIEAFKKYKDVSQWMKMLNEW